MLVLFDLRLGIGVFPEPDVYLAASSSLSQLSLLPAFELMLASDANEPSPPIIPYGVAIPLPPGEVACESKDALESARLPGLESPARLPGLESPARLPGLEPSFELLFEFMETRRPVV